MPAALSYPGVYIEEIPSGVRTITGVATSIAAFIGWAARGPTDKAQLVLSFQDYVRNYGGLDARTYLGYAVNQFFANGGKHGLRRASCGERRQSGGCDGRRKT
jgi:phage tail sheath protein FI